MQATKEHRWCERWKADVPVSLKTDSGVWLQCRIRDISVGGMYVEMTNNCSRSDFVVVRIAVGGAGNRWVQEFPCTVIHHDQRGMGLMLSVVDRSTLPAIETLLDNAEREPRTRLRAAGSAGALSESRWFGSETAL